MSTLMVHKNPSSVPVFDWVRSMTDAWRNYDEIAAALKLMAAVLSDIKVHGDRMMAASTRHWATATDLAAVMVRHADIPWRAAHQITGITVRLAIERGIAPLDLKSELIDEAAVQHFGKPLMLPQELVVEALDPRSSVQRQKGPGGPARERVIEALDLHEAALAKDLAWHQLTAARVATGAKTLELGIDAMLE